ATGELLAQPRIKACLTNTIPDDVKRRSCLAGLLVNLSSIECPVWKQPLTDVVTDLLQDEGSLSHDPDSLAVRRRNIHVCQSGNSMLQILVQELDRIVVPAE